MGKTAVANKLNNILRNLLLCHACSVLSCIATWCYIACTAVCLCCTSTVLPWIELFIFPLLMMLFHFYMYDSL